MLLGPTQYLLHEVPPPKSGNVTDPSNIEINTGDWAKRGDRVLCSKQKNKAKPWEKITKLKEVEIPNK